MKCPEAECQRKFRNGNCDKQCNNKDCLYDGFDCNITRSCKDDYERYCQDHFGNGHCETGCNNAECGWDGGDCTANHEKPGGRLILVLGYNSSILHRRNILAQLRALSIHLHTKIRLESDNKGDMLFRYRKGDKPEELSAEQMERWKYETSKAETSKETVGCVLYVEVFNLDCPLSTCLNSSQMAAQFLEALNQKGEPNLPYSVLEVKSVDPPTAPEGSKVHYQWPLVGTAAGVAVAVIIGVFFGVQLSRKRQHGVLWLPSGFSRHRAQEGSRRREPVGEDSIRLKPMKHDSVYDDSGPEEGIVPPKSRRLKLATDPSILDHRQWSQQHIDAGVRFPQCIALTPPQEEPDGRDVDVRGPDGVTPLMSAICAGGGLEPIGGGVDPPEIENSASVISDLIGQGASLNAQTDSTGETALHLAARFSRQDAGKVMLDAGADTNVQDRLGRTPLHTAIAADALGVFQTLLRCRQTDIDARMHDGSTPLILASRLPVLNMVEELVACGADIGATDKRGKSALHWAAAVNNVPAMKTLLSHGANKDLQDKRDQTALFLAAREGSYEAVCLLLEHQVNRELCDHVGHQPRHAARERGHRDIQRLLEECSQIVNRNTPATPLVGAPQLKKTPRPRVKEPTKPAPLPHIDLSSSCYHNPPPVSAPPFLPGNQSESNCCQSHHAMVNYGGNCPPYARSGSFSSGVAGCQWGHRGWRVHFCPTGCTVPEASYSTGGQQMSPHAHWLPESQHPQSPNCQKPGPNFCSTPAAEPIPNKDLPCTPTDQLGHNIYLTPPSSQYGFPSPASPEETQSSQKTCMHHHPFLTPSPESRNPWGIASP